MKALILFALLFSPFHALCQKSHLDSHKIQRGAFVTTSGSLAIVYASPNSVKEARSTTNLDSNEPIQYGFSSITTLPRIVLVLRPEYGFRISAYSQDGKRVEPTRKGKRFGNYFDSLVAFELKAIDTKKSRPPHWYCANPSDSYPRLVKSVPAPDELFHFKEPGNYTLKIEAACFASKSYPPLSNANPRDYEVVRFPTVDIPIHKK